MKTQDKSPQLPWSSYEGDGVPRRLQMDQQEISAELNAILFCNYSANIKEIVAFCSHLPDVYSVRLLIQVVICL